MPGRYREPAAAAPWARAVPPRVAAVDDDELMRLLSRAAEAVMGALAGHSDWGETGLIAGQYHHDTVADAAARKVLDGAGVGVLSEESGLHRGDAPVVVVLDPVDGSTNASCGIPWFATSLCAVDDRGLRAALVVNLATGARFEATRGGGARRNGAPLASREAPRLSQAIVGLSGFPSSHLGWRQYRALGAAALDLCAVAAGMLDAYVDCSVDAHGPWDYLGGMLVCQEAGAVVVDRLGRDLVIVDHGARRTPVAAADGHLAEALVGALSGS